MHHALRRASERATLKLKNLDTPLVLQSRLDFRVDRLWVALINRCALAPVPVAKTGANAHRLMSLTPKSNVGRASA